MSGRVGLCAVTLGTLLILLPVGPAIAAGGGGGGGGMSAPSQSAPQYDPAAEYQKGIAAYQAQNFKDAVTAFRHVTDVVATHAPAQYLLGSSYLQMGEFKKAKRPLEQAVRHDATMIDAHRDLGVVLAKLGDTAKAGEQRDMLTARKTQCAATCPEAASLDAAIAAVDAAMAGSPQAFAPQRAIAPLASIDAVYVSAVSKINEHRYGEAIAELESSLWAAGPHPDILTYLGFANRKLHRYETAREWYEMALAVAPNHRGALEYYGELKLELGDVAGARQHLARLDGLCGFGCQQADELRRWLRESGKYAS
ncbi:tetratricopeptide repeat protein [Novosphingobium sp.]|uniref:tetratricopeptide repeat protein n=1 Tax=Novosphingobium sp. TaxID=1874826 RepID=UPI0026371B9B|nr:tetratricopeptide repeat protein [Novosphingobium sp.]